eukprot:2463824-Amphidinium_carterae.1
MRAKLGPDSALTASPSMHSECTADQSMIATHILFSWVKFFDVFRLFKNRVTISKFLSLRHGGGLLHVLLDVGADCSAALALLDYNMSWLSVLETASTASEFAIPTEVSEVLELTWQIFALRAFASSRYSLCTQSQSKTWKSNSYKYNI